MDNIQNEYFKYLTLSGFETHNPKTSLKVFFNYIIERDLDYLKLKINEAQDFQTYLITTVNNKGEIRFSKGTVTVIIGCLTTFYKYLKSKKYIMLNPFLDIKKAKRDKGLPKNIFSEEKMFNYLTHLKTFWKGKNITEQRQLYRLHVISELMYGTGMRIGEVVTLKPEDIDFDKGLIRIVDCKSKKQRDCILNEYALKVLKIYITKMRKYVVFNINNRDKSSGLLFGSSGHLKHGINGILTKESEKLKLGKLTSHSFRHAYACHMLRAGCDLRYIQELLGHKLLRSTQVYTRVEKDDLRGVLDKYHPRIFRRSK